MKSYSKIEGALLFDSWFDLPHCPPHDANLRDFGFTGSVPNVESRPWWQCPK